MESMDPATFTQEMLGQPSDPCVMVIFGAGGDLTKRKLIPALYNLAKGKLLPQQFAVVGISREQVSTDDFRKAATEDIKQFSTSGFDATSWQWFAQRLYYHAGDFKDPEVYVKLGELLTQVDKEQATRGNRLFYLATSPTYFPIVVERLGAAGLTNEASGQWSRVVIEKPFGQDLPSAVSVSKSSNRPCTQREPGLQDRPLPRQRDGAEHPRLPFCEWNL